MGGETQVSCLAAKSLRHHFAARHSPGLLGVRTSYWDRGEAGKEGGSSVDPSSGE